MVEYEDKPKPQIKENKVEIAENAKPAAEKEDGETAEMNFFFFTDPNNNYLNYNVEDLIHDLWLLLIMANYESKRSLYFLPIKTIVADLQDLSNSHPLFM